MNVEEVERHGRGGVAGDDHHDGDFVKSCDAKQGYEHGHSHGVASSVVYRTMATAFCHVHGRAMPGSVVPSDRR